MKSAFSNICVNTLVLGFFFPQNYICETHWDCYSWKIYYYYYGVWLSQNLFTSQFRLFSWMLLQIPALWMTLCLRFHKVDFRKEDSRHRPDVVNLTDNPPLRSNEGWSQREPWSDSCNGRSSGCRDTATLKFYLRPKLLWERGSKAG